MKSNEIQSLIEQILIWEGQFNSQRIIKLTGRDFVLSRIHQVYAIEGVANKHIPEDINW